MGTAGLVDNRFVLEAEVGSGGMGTVYRARDTSDGDRVVALKIHTATHSIAVQRFARESTVLASFAHENVVKHIGHGTLSGGRLYVVMEWVEGETLSSRIERRGFSVAEAVAMMKQLAAGLEHIHQRGVLHRDLKPTNVMLVGDRVKIIDFGLAREMRSAQKLTETGAVMGTPGYMSPEQVLGLSDLDVRTDMFTAGCVLYECLTGIPAFSGPTWVAVQAKILMKPAVPPSVFGIALPFGMQELLDDLMTKDLASRLPDMATLRARLDVLAGLDTTVRQTVRGAVPVTRKEGLPWRGPAEPDFLVIALTDREVERDVANAAIAPYEGIVSRLVEGALIVRIDGPDRRDAALRAARSALALRTLSASWPITIVDSRAATLDDATRELAAEEIGALFRPGSATIRLDEETAKLISGELVVTRDRLGFILVPK